MIIKELVGHLPNSTQKKLLRDNAASLYSLDQLEQGALV
jgi:hypothetical protein